MPSRRRSLAASDDDPLASSSSPSSPPPAHPPPPAKKKAGGKATAKATPDTSLDLSDARPAKKTTAKSTTAKGKRKRVEGDEGADPSPRARPPPKATTTSKRAKADTSDSQSSTLKKSRVESDDSDDFIFTKEAYRPPPAGAAAPAAAKRAATNGRAPVASSSTSKASKATKSSAPPPGAAADPKGKKRAVEPSNEAPARQASQDRRAMPPPSAPSTAAGAAAAPTTPRGKTRLNPILHPPHTTGGDSTVDLAPAETPMIKRNIAMRRAADEAAPPSLPGSRRTSFERRGRRGSFVGDGFEAVPHSSVDDALLHRHINPNDLPSMRFMTLVSWSAHRQALSLASSTSGSDRARDVAGKVADAVLANIAKHEIDVRWAEHSSAAAGPSRSRRKLQKNEANERNQQKGDRLDKWMESMNAEQAARNAIKPRYTALKAPRHASAALASVPATSVNYAASALPKLTRPEDVLAYGRSLLAAAQTDPAPSEASRSVSVETELAVWFGQLQLQASSLKQQTHRLDQHARLTDAYALTRLRAAHRALEDLTLGPAPPDAADLLRALSRAEQPPARR